MSDKHEDKPELQDEIVSLKLNVAEPGINQFSAAQKERHVASVPSSGVKDLRVANEKAKPILPSVMLHFLVWGLVVPGGALGSLFTMFCGIVMGHIIETKNAEGSLRAVEIACRSWQGIFLIGFAAIGWSQLNWQIPWSWTLINIARKTSWIPLKNKSQWCKFWLTTLLPSTTIAGLGLGLSSFIIAAIVEQARLHRLGSNLIIPLMAATCIVFGAAFISSFLPAWLNFHLLRRLRERLLVSDPDLGSRIPFWVPSLAPLVPAVATWWFAWNVGDPSFSNFFIYIFFVAPLSYLFSTWCLKMVREPIEEYLQSISSRAADSTEITVKSGDLE